MASITFQIKDELNDRFREKLSGGSVTGFLRGQIEAYVDGAFDRPDDSKCWRSEDEPEDIPIAAEPTKSGKVNEAELFARAAAKKKEMAAEKKRSPRGDIERPMMAKFIKDGGKK